MGFFWNTGDGFLGAITYNLNVSLPPFLVMSGLLLYRPFARAIMTDKPRPSAKTFLVRRGMRILPAYWILCAVAIPLLNSYPGEGFWAKVRPFLLIHTFWPKSDEISGMSTTWFVTTEFTFYLLLPVFAWAIARYARRAVDPWQRAKRMLVPLSLLLVVGFGWTAYINLPSMGFMNNTAYFPFGFIDFFAVGMGLATISAYAEVADRTPAFFRLVQRRPNLLWLGALVVFFLNLPKVIGSVGNGDWPGFAESLVQHALFMLFSLLLIAPLIVPNTRSRFSDVVLSNPVMRFLGRISYGIYLWQLFIITVWYRNGSVFGPYKDITTQQGTSGFWELLAVTLGGSVVIATISYFFLEKPIMRRRPVAKTPVEAVPALNRT